MFNLLEICTYYRFTLSVGNTISIELASFSSGKHYYYLCNEYLVEAYLHRIKTSHCITVC